MNNVTSTFTFRALVLVTQLTSLTWVLNSMITVGSSALSPQHILPHIVFGLIFLGIACFVFYKARSILELVKVQNNQVTLNLGCVHLVMN